MARVKFPHFTLEEAEVLEKFQEAGVLSGKWSYDVRLESKKVPAMEGEPEYIKKMWKAVTAKRIDAVCEDENFIHIIEVKRYMQASGIGQLLLYSHMYAEQFKPFKRIKLWLIAYYPDADVVEFCEQMGIKTWTVVKW